MSQTFEITFVEDAILEKLDAGDDERIASIMFNEDRPTVSLGKAWHVIHVLLTGSHKAGSGPLAFIMGSGRHLGNDPNGGWVCAFDAADLAEIRAVLPSPAKMLERFEELDLEWADTVAWGKRLETQGPEFFLEPYRDLLEALAKADAEDLGMLAGLV
jgi:hypothetical protein